MTRLKNERWQAADALFAAATGKAFPVAAIEVRRGGEVLYTHAAGVLNPDGAPAQPCLLRTRFDLASVTKLLVVTTFMTFVEQDQVTLDTPVHLVLPAFTGLRPIAAQPDPLNIDHFMNIVPPTHEVADAGAVTVRNLLVHNAGLPAWLPLFKARDRAEMDAMALTMLSTATSG
jgi:CubicO group peptidase (beta-lactamase class C family)